MEVGYPEDFKMKKRTFNVSAANNAQLNSFNAQEDHQKGEQKVQDKHMHTQGNHLIDKQYQQILYLLSKSNVAEDVIAHKKVMSIPFVKCPSHIVGANNCKGFPPYILKCSFRI